jgi:NAD-dependent deacetylase
MVDVRLHDYRRIVVLTGAGISVASGLPTYRGAGGLWTDDPERMDAVTAEAAARDPATPWRALADLRGVEALPNAAHRALARAESELPSDASLTIITQNVDGLHLAAGSRSVVELHGNVRRSRCSKRRCGLAPFEDSRATAEPPPCPRCGAPLRPDVVLFNEMLPVDAEHRSKRALRDCELFLAVGTSGTVSPASSFVRSAEYAGARTIYVNLEPMDLPNPAFQETVLGRAEEVLPRLLG